MTEAELEEEYQNASRTGLEAASTADGPVRKHAGFWRKRGDEWCALVANEHEPASGEYVIVKRRDGTTREKLLEERLEVREHTSVWSVRDDDGRYDDNDPDDGLF